MFVHDIGDDLDKLIKSNYRILLTNDVVGMVRNWANLYMAKNGVKHGHYIEIKLGSYDRYSDDDNLETG
ncbi:MAG: hypothetical protein V2I33_22830 [Kangiellaceae bacterium]|jgi:hypothetical protein|nr:hypothetical protein [Kangiellaceae bacterium]